VILTKVLRSMGLYRPSGARNHGDETRALSMRQRNRCEQSLLDPTMNLFIKVFEKYWNPVCSVMRINPLGSKLD
jgi:hypothetical protein